MTWRSFVAMGDSFSEGLNDPYPDGTYRGWADLVAARLAVDAGPDFRYANLAIRGKVLDEVVNEQLEPTLAMKPDLVSVAGRERRRRDPLPVRRRHLPPAGPADHRSAGGDPQRRRDRNGREVRGVRDRPFRG